MHLLNNKLEIVKQLLNKLISSIVEKKEKRQEM